MILILAWYNVSEAQGEGVNGMARERAAWWYFIAHHTACTLFVVYCRRLRTSRSSVWSRRYNEVTKGWLDLCPRTLLGISLFCSFGRLFCARVLLCSVFVMSRSREQLPLSRDEKKSAMHVETITRPVQSKSRRRRRVRLAGFGVRLVLVLMLVLMLVFRWGSRFKRSTVF